MKRKTCLIADLSDPKYNLITDSQDVQRVLESIGKRRQLKHFDGLFVEVLDGDYGEVWGFSGIVPLLGKIATLLN